VIGSSGSLVGNHRSCTWSESSELEDDVRLIIGGGDGVVVVAVTTCFREREERVLPSGRGVCSDACVL
jgi:hypothetical protein